MDTGSLDPELISLSGEGAAARLMPSLTSCCQHCQRLIQASTLGDTAPRAGIITTGRLTVDFSS